ncbi:hypothetical protein [Sphingomonas sp. HMP6]|uniref:hypothetical protein n=1 Tax=Sphingomonas sp. HMP6 TaxID=1517551 RepID=UPI001E3AAFEE|nr:hypothetical protein [Sphingomonas sp. HMP6]
MLAMVDRGAWSADGDEERFGIAITGARIEFDTTTTSIGLAFEQLAAAIEATIAVERARRMIEAAGAEPQLPLLWLVSGSDVLAKWLAWAGVSNALSKALALSDAIGTAPVAGHLDRRARRDLGQGGARIRVRGGVAIAERIELCDQPRCIATLGETARIRIEAHKLPETLICALQKDARANALRPLADVVSHPFFVAAELGIIGVANEGLAVVFEVESHWTPLEPVPAAALNVIPSDADPAFPWRATLSERRRLNGLVEEARHRFAATRDPR